MHDQSTVLEIELEIVYRTSQIKSNIYRQSHMICVWTSKLMRETNGLNLVDLRFLFKLDLDRCG